MELDAKRIYAARSEQDGLRILVDGLWPRGLAKEKAGVDLWVKEIAPSKELRQWFAHDPGRWDEFKRRYFRELDANKEAVTRLLEAAQGQKATLLFAARDQSRNNAVALKEYLELQGAAQ